jgi:hypothetical protein
MKVYNLVPPETDISKYIGYNVGLRPSRKDGPRLEREVIGSKIVYHNYGHGGNGVAMGYGSSKLVVGMCANEVGLSKAHVAVVGCGYMGLYSAILLRECGYEVTIYADVFPAKFGVFNESSAKLTSQIAAGQIFPAHFPHSPNRPLTNWIFRCSFDHLRDMYHKKKYQGLYKRDIFYIRPHKHKKDEFVHGTMPHLEEVKINFGNGRLIQGYRTSTFQLDGDIHLFELLEEARHAGVRIENKRFENIKEILGLNEEVIFNCSGLSSRYLFNDNTMIPYKGVMISLKKPNNFDYFLDVSMKEGEEPFNAYPMNERISYGIIRVVEEELGYQNEQKYFEILYNHLKQFKVRYLDPEPKL